MAQAPLRVKLFQEVCSTLKMSSNSIEETEQKRLLGVTDYCAYKPTSRVFFSLSFFVSFEVD